MDLPVWCFPLTLLTTMGGTPQTSRVMNMIKSVSGKWLIIALLACLGMSCAKEENEQPVPSDPLIGLWQLRVIYTQEQGAVEVTDRPCYRDSRFDVKEKSLSLKLSSPTDQGECNIQTLSFGWLNDNGTYYLVNEDGEREPLNVVLNDNNETLQLNLTSNGQPFSLIFRK